MRAVDGDNNNNNKIIIIIIIIIIINCVEEKIESSLMF